MEERTECSGIYTRTTRTASDPASMLALLKSVSEKFSHDRATWLDRTQQAVEAILQDEKVPGEARRDAGEALRMCLVLRHPELPAQERDYTTFLLGQVYERLGVREWEPLAVRGLENLDQLATARQAREQRSRSRQQRIRAAFDAITKECPEWSVDDRAAAVAKGCRCKSKSTVYNALRDGQK